jgi:hypothetical protein
MLYLAYPVTGGGFGIVKLPPGQTAAQTAESFGLTMAVCAGFDMSTFDAGSENFPAAFSVVNNQPAANTASFSLASCKSFATALVQGNFSNSEVSAQNGYTAQAIASQAALPEIDRIPAIQTAIEQINDLSVQLQTTLAAVAAATSATQVSSLAFPPYGRISTGRGGDGDGPLDLNNSFYTEFNSTSLTEAETELYIPGTDIVLNYGAVVPNGFTSNGDCFVPGDYLVQIREAATGLVLSEFQCPLTTVNINVQFGAGPLLQ